MQHFILLWIILWGCVGCGEPKICLPKDKNGKYFYLDILGDSGLDTLVIKRHPIDTILTDIILIQSGEEKLIMTVCPRSFDGRYVLTTPQIETIVLMSNYTQSDSKELRVMIRNTDMIPDFLFIDLKYDKKWIVKRYYLCNTTIDATIFISSISVDSYLIDELGNSVQLNQNDVIDRIRKKER